MKERTRSIVSTAVAAMTCLWGVDVAAASIAGRVTDLSGQGVPGLEVRLWSAGPPVKTLGIVQTQAVAADGTFAFVDPPAGTYLVDARMGPTLQQHFGDRWFDVAEPFYEGWRRSGADLLAFDAVNDVGGVNILMLEQGTLEGRVLDASGAPLTSGVIVRVEQGSQVEYNHVGRGQQGCCEVPDGNEGRFVMRGLRPFTDYRIFLHDTSGVHETQLAAGPFSVESGVSTAIEDLPMTPAAPDPYEPNNAPDDLGAASIDATTLFRSGDRTPFVTVDARIGPRNGDIDWYCLDVERNDRFLAYTTTADFLGGVFSDNPYVDPVLSFWTGDRAIMLAESDDAPGVGLNAAIDTGPLSTAGPYCFAVSTFGDVAWDGTNQGSAGRYTLIVELGNRSPTLSPMLGGAPVPVPPGRAVVSEGVLFSVDLNATDPDGDALIFTYEMVDADGTVMTEATFDTTPDAEKFLWTPSFTAGDLAPYEVTVTASDGEFSVSRTFVLDVRTVNVQPYTPVLVSPIGGVTVPTSTPALTLENSLDPDGDPVTFEFEVYLGTPSGTPAQTGSVPSDASGSTSFVVTALPEDSVISWRARARDNYAIPGLSPWTEYETFSVNESNQAPTTPELIKPTDGEVVLSRTPAIASSNAEDADGDTVVLVFEVATDAAFTTIVATSAPQTQNLPAGRTSWAVEPALEWDASYFVRVYAEDSLGSRSAYSEARSFSVKPNGVPATPTFGDPFSGECARTVFADEAPTAFVVPAVQDPEREDLQIEVEVYEGDDDPATSEPLYAESQTQTPDATDTTFIPPDGTFAEDGSYRIRVRASDAELSSPWTECTFRVNTTNAPPLDVTIVSPADGTELLKDVTSLDVVFGLLPDADGDPLTVLWCAALQNQVCPTDPNTWLAVDAGNAAELTVQYTGFSPGDTITVSVAARDAAGALSGVATATYTVEPELRTITPSLCACEVTPSRSVGVNWALIGLALLLVSRRRSARGAA